jgi:hypothetical protein
MDSSIILSVDGSETKQRLMPQLGGTSVKCRDFMKVWEDDDPRYRIASADSHSSALADRLVASRLVQQLGIVAKI